MPTSYPIVITYSDIDFHTSIHLIFQVWIYPQAFNKFKLDLNSQGSLLLMLASYPIVNIFLYMRIYVMDQKFLYMMRNYYYFKDLVKFVFSNKNI